MKDELLKVLNIKLKYLSDNIDALNRMNNNLERENKGLDYVRSILKLLEISDGKYSVYNFSKLEKDNFEKIMTELSDEVKVRFENENCNYEGLIYLINGINNGISLKLTDEQIDAIDFMINAIVNLQMDYLARIDGVLLARAHLEISDLDELTNIKNKYNNIVNKLDTGDYIDETEEIIDAINYSRISNDKIVEMLSYLLQYNSEIYRQKKEETSKEIKSDQVIEDNKESELDLSKPFMVSDEKENDNVVEMPSFQENEYFNNLKLDNIDAFSSFEDDTYEFDNNVSVEDDVFSENNEELDDIVLPEVDLDEDVETMVDEDFRDLVDEDDLEENDSQVEKTENETSNASENEVYEAEGNEESKLLTEEVIKTLFEKYKLKFNELNEEKKDLMLKGNIDNYQSILALLKEKSILNIYEKNLDLLIQTLVNSDIDTIEKILEIIEKDLSVDKEDKEVTTDIIISALPSVFVKEPFGNHETFIKNVNSFKEWKIDLINLFDFSREIFVINHELMTNNYETVKSYGLQINDKNAKYLLVLPNIASKLDYYVETVATDTMKNGTGKTFDGIEYIKLYPNKLNTVNDITIKRLRYSSENGKKLFGAKENSLAGEITNLKVDVLNMGDEYLRNYFNNDFDVISRDEKLRYEKLIQEETNYSLKLDETLESLNQYLNGLRYNIEGINISRNKLIRNYNTLIKNGIDKTKALIFAACYNAVITKEEYQKVKNTLINIGGR